MGKVFEVLEREKQITGISFQQILDIDFNQTNIDEQAREKINRAKKLLLQIDSLTTYIPLADQTIDTIVFYYQQILNYKDTQQLELLQNLNNQLEEILICLNKYQNTEPSSLNETYFDLFANFDGDIINGSFIWKEKRGYLRYKLKNGNYYYAIIPGKEIILSSLSQFQVFSKLQLTRAEIEKMLCSILRNAQIYYSLKEYIRYIQFFYKESLVKFDQYVVKVRKMEENLKTQLQFVSSLAPVFNGGTSPDFPNIIYQDVPPKDFYDKSFLEKEEKTAEEWTNYFIGQVLGNATKQVHFSTKDILNSIYGSKGVKELLTLDFDSENLSLKTGEEDQKEYLKERLAQWQQVKQTKELSKSIIRKEDRKYFDINTVLDLNIAASISDMVHKEGQGFFAMEEFLRTKKVTKFTSQYGARVLAQNVNQEYYWLLLIENMIKSFANSLQKAKEDNTYLVRMKEVFLLVQEQLALEEFSFLRWKEKLLMNNKVLKDAITNFDYQFLDKTSKESLFLSQAIMIGKKAKNLSVIKIAEILNKIDEQKAKNI